MQVNNSCVKRRTSKSHSPHRRLIADYDIRIHRHGLFIEVKIGSYKP
jgi:hypothetical protein